jgi:hypothetical protein
VEDQLKANLKFKMYSAIFNNLMNEKMIETPYPVMSMTISFDNSRILTVLKKSEFVSFVHGYCIYDYDLEFEEQYGEDDSGNCIKMKDVEQNLEGNYYAAAY